MLQFDVALYRTRDNVAHLSALVTRQAGKVRRYKSEVASEFISDVEGFIPTLKALLPAGSSSRLARGESPFPSQKQALRYKAEAFYEEGLLLQDRIGSETCV